MRNFDKVKEQWKLDGTQSFDSQICSIIREMRGIKEYQHTWECGSCKECYKWLKQEYKKSILDKEPILGDVEREYLSAVIRPFRGRIIYIFKIKLDCKEFIKIMLKDDIFALPFFETGTMYKGMKLHKRYTLKELGL